MCGSWEQLKPIRHWTFSISIFIFDFFPFGWGFYVLSGLFVNQDKRSNSIKRILEQRFKLKTSAKCNRKKFTNCWFERETLHLVIKNLINLMEFSFLLLSFFTFFCWCRLQCNTYAPSEQFVYMMSWRVSLFSVFILISLFHIHCTRVHKVIEAWMIIWSANFPVKTKEGIPSQWPSSSHFRDKGI